MARLCVFLLCLLGCSGSATKDAEPKVALVVLDGFGLRLTEDPGNAVLAALKQRPDGFLARALVKKEYPTIALGASGRCVGLPDGMMGNSEAGHSNICARDVVTQARTAIDDLEKSGALYEAPVLVAAIEKAKTSGKPLHIVGFVAENSSTGDYGHIKGVLRLAARHGLRDVQLHLLCDGSGKRTCADMTAELTAVVQETGVGTFATVMGHDDCFDRTGVSPRVSTCYQALLAPAAGSAPKLADVLRPLTLRQEADFPAQHLAGGKPITDDDVVLALFYRRDDPEGLIRLLRHRAGESDPPSPRGPLVVTYGLLDDARRYDDDPLLKEAFTLPRRSGFLQSRLSAAGINQFRLAEEKKTAHVTYFCDGGHVPEGPSYRHFQPRSMRDAEMVKSPCLATPTVVREATQAVEQGKDRFIMMNLPNADLLGHEGDVTAAAEGVRCLDTELTRFVTTATAKGYDVFVTADHGNAEQMIIDGVVTEKHTTNVVPFIAARRAGAPPFRLVTRDEPPCLYHVSWTVVDALGLEPGNKDSLLAQ